MTDWRPSKSANGSGDCSSPAAAPHTQTFANRFVAGDRPALVTWQGRHFWDARRLVRSGGGHRGDNGGAEWRRPAKSLRLHHQCYSAETRGTSSTPAATSPTRRRHDGAWPQLTRTRPLNLGRTHTVASSHASIPTTDTTNTHLRSMCDRYATAAASPNPSMVGSSERSPHDVDHVGAFNQGGLIVDNGRAASPRQS